MSLCHSEPYFHKIDGVISLKHQKTSQEEDSASNCSSSSVFECRRTFCQVLKVLFDFKHSVRAHLKPDAGFWAAHITLNITRHLSERDGPGFLKVRPCEKSVSSRFLGCKRCPSKSSFIVTLQRYIIIKATPVYKRWIFRRAKQPVYTFLRSIVFCAAGSHIGCGNLGCFFTINVLKFRFQAAFLLHL